MDIIHKISNITDHNRGAVAGVVVLIATLALGGCQNFDGKVVSSQSGQVLSGDELRGEYIQASSKLKARLQAAQASILSVSTESDGLDAGFESDLQAAQSELVARNQLVGKLGEVASTTAGVPWLLPLITIGTTALAGGVTLDNRRKDRLIRDTKTTGVV